MFIGRESDIDWMDGVKQISDDEVELLGADGNHRVIKFKGIGK